MLNKLPETLLNQMEQIPSFDRVSFLLAHQEPAVTSVRLHPLKKGAHFDGTSTIKWCDEGLYLPQRPVFTLDPLFHSGAYYVQEASSMFLKHVMQTVVDQAKGLRVLDLCAAPGGKSTLLATFLDETSLLISNEVIRSRATILEENMVRWGYPNTWVTANDPKDLGKLKGYFDIIVVDAPCSGSGLFRKDQRVLEEWSESNVQLCSQRQQRILADIWPALKENGVLIYATCSYSIEEDEAILSWLKTSFSVEKINIPLSTEWNIVQTETDGLQGFRFMPHLTQGEGFFISILRKKEQTNSLPSPKFKSIHEAKQEPWLNYFLNNKSYKLISPNQSDFHAIHPDHEADFHRLKSHVYFRKLGVQLGAPVGKDWIPSHEVALSIERSIEIPSIELNKEDALRFLKKENFEIEASVKGWQLITYKDLGLGWIKALGNRFNNYLPKHWRIRMEIDEI